MKWKRIVCVPLLAALALVLLIAPAAVPARAASNVMLAGRGAAAVDGIRDEKYDETMVVTLSRPGVGKISTRVLWDENYLYLFSEVFDSNVVKTPADLVSPWYSDSVEYFFDRRNSKGNWDVDDFQLRVDNGGRTSGMTSVGMSDADTAAERNAIESAVKKTELGYDVEVKFPLSNQSVTVTGSDGLEIGFDVQFNNTSEPAIRESYLTWQGAGNASPAGWGTLKLMDVVPEEDRIPNTAEVTIEAGQNVALNKVAMMSMGYAWDKKPGNVNDGILTTAAQACGNKLWEMTIDLAYETAIDRIVVYSGSGDYASSYGLYYYHPLFGEWTELAAETGVSSGKRVETKFEEIETRFIRFVPKETVGGGTDSVWDFYGYAINEIEIYSSRMQVVTLDAPIPEDEIFSTDGKSEVLPASDSGYEVFRNFKPESTNRTLNAVTLVLAIVFGAAALGGGAALLLLKFGVIGGGKK